MLTLTEYSFYPATAAISEWFDQKRGLALGIAVAGSSAGGIFWPIIINKMLVSVGESTTQRLMAAISTPLLLASALLIVEGPNITTPNTQNNQNNFWRSMLEWKFLALSGALFCIYCGMLIPFFFIPLFAESNGQSSSMGNNLLAISYGGSVIGRIVAGWLADR